MGMNDAPKFCKVTVHPSVSRPPRPWDRARGVVRATVAYKQPPQRTSDELARWTATGAAAIDGLTRRRAATTTATMDVSNPLSRMTLRRQPATPSDASSPEAVVVATAEGEQQQAHVEPLEQEETQRNDSLFRVDTDGTDPIRQTFDDENKLFIPGTPPIPAGITVDMLPTAYFTPEIPASILKRTACTDSDALFDTPSVTDDSSTSESPRESRIRFSTDDESHASSLFAASGYEDALPTPMLASSSVGTPATMDAPTDDTAPALQPTASTLQDIDLTPPTNPLMISRFQEDNEEDEAEEVEEGASSFIDVDSDDDYGTESDDADMDFDVCDNFDAILGEPLPGRASRWRFSLSKKSFSSRTKRGMSSPPRMVAVPPPTLARHMSVPANNRTGYPAPVVHPPAGEPLYHGQQLHLAFKSSTGHVIQVSSHQRWTPSSVFSKLIRCTSVEDPFVDSEDSLRIIGHTTDGQVRGGDRISLARGDGAVLRIQKLSRKLCFSPKIDTKAKFVVCGVPEGTVVTSTTKFYLQSVYDRSKTVGFLKSRRHPGSGCLVTYAYRTTDDKSEPIQFFKRAPPPHHELLEAERRRQLQHEMAMGGLC